MRLLMRGVLTLAVSCSGMAFALECIPAGECATVSWALPELDSPGFPVGATWADEMVKLRDRDGFSPDDFMGWAEIIDGMVAADFCNAGGNIVGPNGAIVEGGLKGSCVEVYFTADFDYTASMKVCSSTGFGSPGGGGISMGSSRCVTVEIHRRSRWTSPTVEICPC